MLRNYLAIFYRIFRRQKVQSTISVAGLALGLASAILIGLYIHDELTFNSMHPKPDRTYRIGFGYVDKDGNTNKNRLTFGSWARRMKEELPEVEQTLRMLHVTFPTTVFNKEDDKSTLTDERRWVEPTFPEVFHLDVVKGTTAGFFEQPNAMALSESVARELFGDKDPIGRILTVNDKEATKGQDVDMVVAVVYKDFPANSTFKHQYLFNLASLKPFIDNYDQFLEENMFEVYVVLKDGADVNKLYSFMDTLSTELEKQYAEYVNDVFAVPVTLTGLHFNNEATWEFKGSTGDKKYLAILFIIAVLILIIACINYMNLTTAKAIQRAKEVGIRKSFGSSRIKLAGQFILESFIVTLVALILSYLMAVLFLSRFNMLSDKNFNVSDLFRPDILWILLGVIVFTILMGGSYPAFMLSGFKPITALRGKAGAAGNRTGQFFRQSLVTVQYAVSISLTIAAIVIYRQVGLMHDSKLNERGDQLMMLRFGSTVPYAKFFPLRNDLLQDPEIEAVSVGDAFPRLDHWGSPALRVNVPEISDEEFRWNQELVDFDFLKTFDISLVAGRGFNPDNPGDTLTILVNETAVKKLGLTNDEAVGHIASIVLYDFDDKPDEIVQRKIIGVVKDFPYQNMKLAVEPLMLNPNPNLRGYKAGTMVYVKLPKNKIQEKIKFVEATWKKDVPDIGLQYYFVNDLFGRLYKSEMTISSLTVNFSVLAILITVFGLFGLASFATERRTKEIGVRKVHGASLWQIVGLLMVSFVKVFLIAAVIVVPVDYFILRDWLAEFRYQTSLGFFVFGVSLGLILMVTILTVGYETIKAAVANPAKSLRYE